MYIFILCVLTCDDVISFTVEYLCTVYVNYNGVYLFYVYVSIVHVDSACSGHLSLWSVCVLHVCLSLWWVGISVGSYVDILLGRSLLTWLFCDH